MVKKYLKHFKYLFLILGILCVVYLIVFLLNSLTSKERIARSNTETTVTERVFDYADVLSAEEEENLRELIAEKEGLIACDIVLVTWNESLEKYALGYEDVLGSLSVEEYAMVFADNFYDEHKFGYNKAYGDGVLYLDNWGREADGYRYTWFSTSGKAEDTFSNDKINDLIDRVIEQTNADPYQAYVTYVNQVAATMEGGFSFQYKMPGFVLLVLALISTGSYISFQMAGKKNKKTTNAETYIATGHLNFDKKEDGLLNKMVTSRRIPKTTSSGGGGHMSAGGHSHGGGGGRH